MKVKKRFLVSTFLSLFILTSCGGKSLENDFSNDVDNEMIQETTNSLDEEIEEEIIETPMEEAYEVGETPDDYNMDYDTSRLKTINEKKSKFYPKEGVKGLYLNPYISSDPALYNNIINLIETTDLNTVVVDIKDDWGNITIKFDTDNEDIIYATSDVLNAKEFIKSMHSKGIYVIGRIPTFKDSVITQIHPDWGFTTSDGSLWKNSAGEAFMNPYSEDVRRYEIEIAKLAAKAGFDELQFDYIRFAEGFETFEDSLSYSKGEWEEKEMTDAESRIDAITSFVKLAREELQKYSVPIGIDVFGYALQVRTADGIGQDFEQMSSEADVLSSMIYPSHWSSWSYELEKPDLEPYELVKRYLTEEQEVLASLTYKPLSRPWIQDFTASWIGEGNYMEYDAKAVEDQINAIYDMGQKEFLLWNASGEYTKGVEY